jgi:hypothetical protein
VIVNNYLAACVGVIWMFCGILHASSADPILTRVPNDGIQPQALNGADGTAHLLYYKGDPKAGDLFYVRRPGASKFSDPIQVNSSPGSAIAIGTIRGAQIALGKNGLIHVAWNKSGNANDSGMMYSRLNDRGTTFEPERNLMTVTEGLDGGGSLAADGSGNVYVVWHGLVKNGPRGETNRAVFVATSTNDGRSFATEKKAVENRLGACACCGMKAYATSTGKLFVLYRSARIDSERDETLLESDDGAKTFKVIFSHPWSISTCPMSSAWLGSGFSDQVVAGWETKGRTWFMNLPSPADNLEPFSISNLANSPGEKNPIAVTNGAGQMLVLWTEGTGWQKGGAVVWRILDSQRNLTGSRGRQDGVPVWSFAAAVSRPDGTFEIFF